MEGNNQSVKKTVPKWRDVRIARAHGNILNLSYAYVSCADEFKLNLSLSCVEAYEFKLRGRLSTEFWTVSSEHVVVPFREFCAV